MALHGLVGVEPTSVLTQGLSSRTLPLVARAARWLSRRRILFVGAFVAALDVRAWAIILDGGVVFPVPGQDLDLYLAATREWLGGGSFYRPDDIARPFAVEGLPNRIQPILYPPTSLLLFIPFTVLPAIAWWVLPLAVTSLALRRQRPGRLVWALIALFAVWPPTVYAVVAGNPAMWMMAMVALSTRYPGVMPWVFLKPTLAPLALLQACRRSWWLGLGALVAASVMFAPMWLDYVAVLTNARSAYGVFYSLAQLPLMLIPLVALVPKAVPCVAGFSPQPGPRGGGRSGRLRGRCR